MSSRFTECIFAGPRIDLMSTTILFYIVKDFGLIKREWGSNENAIKVFQAKLLAIKEKTYCHQGIIKLVL
jgi:hypothetical protein